MTRSREPRSSTPYRLIETQADFAAACADLARSPWVAVDTEFVGERTYYPRLELLQLFAGDVVYLVDARGVRDWAPLAPILTGSTHEVLMHAAAMDLDIVQRILGDFPRRLFDSQLAAAFLGYGLQISLTNLVRSIAGRSLDDKQTSDWSHRPLRPDQLAYAADDVWYLPVLRDAMLKELDRTGRRAWYEGEQAARIAERAAYEEPADTERWRRVKVSSGMSSRELAILRELAAWRESSARSLDIPRRTLMPDEGLVELARQQPRTREAMSKLRRVPTGPAMKHSGELLAAIERGRAIPQEECPRRERTERREVAPGILELASALIRRASANTGVASQMLATTDELNDFVTRVAFREQPTGPLSHGWRGEIVGNDLIALLEGRLALYVSREGVQRLERPEAAGESSASG